MNTIRIAFGKQVHAVPVDLDLICALEDGLKSVSELHKELCNQNWRFIDLIAVAQIALQASGCETDYMELGRSMLKNGTATLREDLQKALAEVIR
jgi:hypothetical protein